MKVVINNCFGGFSLSKAAVKRMAELQGRPCYFFKSQLGEPERYVPSSAAEDGLFWLAFDIPNPNEVLARVKPWHDMTMEERQAENELHRKHSLESRPSSRTDPLLIQVIEELGESADGALAKLKIVEIPDDVQFEIDEYDGLESIHEVHRSWR